MRTGTAVLPFNGGAKYFWGYNILTKSDIFDNKKTNKQYITSQNTIQWTKPYQPYVNGQ